MLLISKFIYLNIKIKIYNKFHLKYCCNFLSIHNCGGGVKKLFIMKINKKHSVGPAKSLTFLTISDKHMKGGRGIGLVQIFIRKYSILNNNG